MICRHVLNALTFPPNADPGSDERERAPIVVDCDQLLRQRGRGPTPARTSSKSAAAVISLSGMTLCANSSVGSTISSGAEFEVKCEK
jgi:hypothetical protein